MLIDSHAHMDMEEFEKDRTDVIDRAFKGGLTHILTVGIDLDSSRAAEKLSQQHDGIYSAVGYHPHNADSCDSRVLKSLTELASQPGVVAWGEIGLDFFRRHSSIDAQLKAFSLQLKIADDLGLPVIIHDREAHKEVLEILKKRGKGKKRGVIHCFSGDIDLADEFMDLGYYISIPGTVTYKKANLVKDVASRIPLSRMLVETDAPFLAPVPQRGKRNEPVFVNYTAREIARIRDIAFEEVSAATSQNAQELFGLP